MTAGELRAALQDIPDDTEVVAYDRGDPSVGIWEANYGVAGAHRMSDWDDDLNAVTLPYFVIELSS